MLQVHPRERIRTILVDHGLDPSPSGLGIFSTGPLASSPLPVSGQRHCALSRLWWWCGKLAYAAVFFNEALSGALTTVYQSAPGIRAKGRLPCSALFGGG